MTVVNTYPYVFLTKVLYDKLMNRKNLKNPETNQPPRTCIINVSSVASTSASPYQCIYGCTKAFERFFSDSLRFEVQMENKHMDVLTI